ncbi:ABC transporter ATP-binding protein [Alphaproteobacteria bacterium]|nr:ABC transporter ATP-binding protein [Alphaproteobacteria bacterium]MDA9815686.1 ABC transporter ATP-binding protein [Alphaproteobacteria bacterium]MDC0462113.1 ABC transporter ATP-binding protein [Alphaproteobacteria bacterium]MDC3311757.1 ABC transporter ATP-binding protein [Alphaproteobacteria bacterium]
MLKVQQLEKWFGGIHAVNDVSLTFETGKITGLIGPNGAGKTTLFNIIAGLHKPSSGRVFLNEMDITGLPPHELFAQGVLRTFQIAHEFSTLPVRDNLMMVPSHQSGEMLLNVWLRPNKIKQEEERLRQKAEDVLAFLKLSSLADEPAGNLSGGQKKLLELGRCMMVDAKIVFLDEVGAGVNRTLLNHLGEAIIRLNQERNYTFCMIEHDIEFIGKLCDSVIVMAEGSVLATDNIEAIKSNPEVIDAYLGRGMKNKS